MTAKVTYLGGLRNEALHPASGQLIVTDAPVDNHGKGEAFSPTDLVAAALGACMQTIIGIQIQKGSLPLLELRVEVQKQMAEAPRRIGALTADIYVTGQLTETQRRLLENAALHCPVAKSLHPDLAQNIRFHYLSEPR